MGSAERSQALTSGGGGLALPGTAVQEAAYISSRFKSSAALTQAVVELRSPGQSPGLVRHSRSQSEFQVRITPPPKLDVKPEAERYAADLSPTDCSADTRTTSLVAEDYDDEGDSQIDELLTQSLRSSYEEEPEVASTPPFTATPTQNLRRVGGHGRLALGETQAVAPAAAELVRTPAVDTPKPGRSRLGGTPVGPSRLGTPSSCNLQTSFSLRPPHTPSGLLSRLASSWKPQDLSQQDHQLTAAVAVQTVCAIEDLLEQNVAAAADIELAGALHTTKDASKVQKEGAGDSTIEVEKGPALIDATNRRRATVSRSHDLGSSKLQAKKGEAAVKLAPRTPIPLKAPLPLSREVHERIQSLGTELPVVHKVILWAGILLDLGSKVSLGLQLSRLAHHREWAWFAMFTAFFACSSAVVTLYWLGHYPNAVAEQLVSAKSAAQPGGSHFLGMSKGQVRRCVRRLGTLCAVLQLGTGFAAARALTSSERRQRLVAMDLRGMRLADTVFLTMPVTGVNIYIGMLCTRKDLPCGEHHGFNVLLFCGVVAALIGATLAYVAMDLNDLKLVKGVRHLLEIVTFFVYRLLELASRLVLLALFAITHDAYVFVVLAAHIVLMIAALRFSPFPGQARVWAKLTSTTHIHLPLCCCRPGVPVPAGNDVKLLLACLAWPPSCFVSDATDRTGQFWWRARMVGRKSCWGVTLDNRLVPFPVWALIVGIETAAMMGTIYWTLPKFATRYFQVAVTLHMVWLGWGMIWLAVATMCAHYPEDSAVDRALAQREIEEAEVYHPAELPPLKEVPENEAEGATVKAHALLAPNSEGPICTVANPAVASGQATPPPPPQAVQDARIYALHALPGCSLPNINFSRLAELHLQQLQQPLQ